MPYRVSIYINDRKLYDEIMEEWVRLQKEEINKKRRVSINEVIVDLIKIGLKAKKMGIR